MSTRPEASGTPFEVSDVVIPPGSYQWRRTVLKRQQAQKAACTLQLRIVVRRLYNGKLDQ